MAHPSIDSADLKKLTWFEGKWQDGNIPILDPISPASWLSLFVFDGARAFDGVAPDLDRHCARVCRSAEILGMKPDRSAKEIETLAWDGIAQFSGDIALYVRPMFFAGSGFIQPNPDDTKFALVLEEMPLPGADGFSACVSSFRRPSPEMAPTEAKASCLYPNVARALGEANRRGFDNAIMMDPIGNVAEFASANLFIVKDGTAHTPMPNGTFLNGVTRQRVMQLLREAGVEVVERRLRLDEVLDADEVFSTGNYGKVQPTVRLEDRNLQPGPVFRKARERYFDWARSLPSNLKA